ncbi:hypothetical protein ASPVEDRAFT_83375 [Aspergillus versicolor CBS 583.65]|uniref:Uncharacterized protein n=1 Tax=Aspergillus versicolor CBS 583.65 TaxID=1036611 RepID=A0A1L9PK27_ASPVE|nr:uncharacterized protein ASPVEDRAFT_83375 [Aspergillus versicolor CBS 583.65]OJJ01851.1 hypothetical protein ASPVEDRAFT_83375 [Aspergillus versicolor CBS 583.65]
MRSIWNTLISVSLPYSLLLRLSLSLSLSSLPPSTSTIPTTNEQHKALSPLEAFKTKKDRLQRAETERKISLRDFERTASEWEQTDKVQSIFQQIKAQETTVRLYQPQADELGPQYGGGSLLVLRDELGRPFWGTPGRYMPRNMVLALVEELGHDYKGILAGATCSRGIQSCL